MTGIALAQARVAQLCGYLEKTVAGFRGPLEVSAFTGGRSNPTFLVRTPTRRFVLRSKPRGTLAPTAHRIEREFRVLRALRGSPAPVPNAIHFCDDVSVLGAPFYLMSFEEGAVTESPALPGYDALTRTRMYVDAIDALAKVHRVDWSAAGLQGFGRTEGYLARQMRRFAEQYQALRTGEMPATDALLATLSTRLPAQRAVSIVHGDYRLGNLMFAADGKVAAILDWELSTLGDPLADLAYFMLGHTLDADTAPLPGLYGLDLEALGIPGEAELVHRYLEAMETTPSTDWPLYKAFSFFRFVVINMGVYRRQSLNETTPLTPHQYREVERLAEIGLARSR